MNVQGWLTWSQFLIVALLLLLIYIILTQSRLKYKLLSVFPMAFEYTPMRVFLGVLAVLFISIDPVSHGIILGVAYFIFYKFISNTSTAGQNSTIEPDGVVYVEVRCEIGSGLDVLKTKRLIEKSLYSTPYIPIMQKPVLSVQTDHISVKVPLLSTNYTLSLLTLLEHAGLSPTLIIK